MEEVKSTANFVPTIIASDIEAENVAKELKRLCEENVRLNKLTDAEEWELQQRRIEINAEFEKKTGYLKTMLDEYMSRMDCHVTKTKATYRLLSGVCVHEFGGWNFDRVKGSPELLAWIKENKPEYIKPPKPQTEEVNWSEFKKSITVLEDGTIISADGEIVGTPDVSIKAERKPDSFKFEY